MNIWVFLRVKFLVEATCIYKLALNLKKQTFQTFKLTTKPLSYSSPVVVFFFFFIVSIHASGISIPLSLLILLGWSLTWIASLTLRLAVWVTINKLYLVPKRVVSGVVGVFRNGEGLGTGESDVPVVFFDPVLHRSSRLTDVKFATFTENPVNNAILLSGINSVVRPY